MSNDEPSNKKTIMGYAAKDLHKLIDKQPSGPQPPQPQPPQPQPPQPQPPQPQPPQPQPYVQQPPPQAHQPPVAQPHYQQPGPPVQQPMTAPPAPQGRAKWPFIVGGVAVIGAGVTLALVLGGGDDDNDNNASASHAKATPDAGTAATAKPPTPPPANKPKPPTPAAPTSFNDRFAQAMQRSYHGKGRDPAWPCSAQVDRYNDGTVDQTETFTYAGPQHCRIPGDQQKFGCPTKTVLRDSRGKLGRQKQLAYDDKGRLIALAIKKSTRGTRVLFNYDNDKLVSAEVDRDNDGKVDRTSGYERKGDELRFYANAAKRTKPSMVATRRDGHLVATKRSFSTNRFDWQGNRVTTQTTTIGKRVVAVVRFTYDCPAGAATSTSTTTTARTGVPSTCSSDDQHELEQCAKQARALEDGRGMPADPKRAAAMFAAACEHKHGISCLGAALLYSHGAPGLGKDGAKARHAAERGCTMHARSACGMAANLYERGVGGPKDTRKAAALYERGCANRVWMACANAGALYAAGNGVAKAPRKAVRLWERACDHKDARACAMLGLTLAQGKLTRRNIPRAKRKLRRACKLGFRSACKLAARLH